MAGTEKLPFLTDAVGSVVWRAYIDLPPIPAVRYQDEDVGVAEVEVRWNLTPRSARIGFIGAGRAHGAGARTSTRSAPKSRRDFRYRIARRLKLYAGLDYG